MKSKLICILGKSGSGKDSLITTAIKKSIIDFRMVCSYTDRPIRDGETDGVEHYFITTEEFNKLKEERKDDILAYTHIKNDNQTNYNGYQYMALNDELEKSHIYIIDYKGLQYLKKKYGDKVDIVTVYITAPFFTRLKRVKTSRSDFKKEFKNRVKAENAQFKEFEKSKSYDYKIINKNGKFEKSVETLLDIIECEMYYYCDHSNYPNLKTSKEEPQKTNS